MQLAAALPMPAMRSRTRRVRPHSRTYLHVALLILCGLIFRLLYNACRELAPDEAYYWVWSRHLSLSYLDHPPMIAYLIWASTKLMGSTEFAVRAPAALLSAGTSAVGAALTWRLTGSGRATWVTALILVISPILSLTGTLMTPDTPLVFFYALGLFIAIRLADDPAGAPLHRWLAWGGCCGLAMLSKYTGLFLALSVAVLFLQPAWWRALRRPGPYLAVLLALLLFSPVLIWNATHDWASFRYQLGHGFIEDERPGLMGFLGFAGSVIVTWSPVLFALTVVAATALVKRFRQLGDARRLLLVAVLLPLMLFTVSSWRKKVEGNWPAFVFPEAVVLIAAWANENWGERSHAVRMGWQMALVFTVVAQLPELALVAHLRIPVANDVFGWRELAARVDAEAEPDEAPVVCSSYQNAAELSFYLPGQPDVWSVNTNHRSNAYDYFAGAPQVKQMRHAVFVSTDASVIAQYFPHVQSTNLTLTHLERPIRTRTLSMASR